jgi:hypothetical protein
MEIFDTNAPNFILETKRIDFRLLSVKSDSSHLPVEAAEFGEPAKISFVGGDDADAAHPGAHRDQCIVAKSTLPDFFIAVFCGDTGQHSAHLSPVAEIRNQNPFRAVEVPFQPFDGMTGAITRSRIKFLKHDRTQPHNRTRVQPSNC